MGMTAIEKILARAGGLDKVSPGDLVAVKVDTAVLFDNNFNPTDSGDGVTKVGKMDCIRTEPHVYMVVNQPDLLEAEVERLWTLLQGRKVRLFAGPMTPEAAEELGVKWEGVPEGVVAGSLEGSYAPGGPALIMLVGLNDVIMGLRDGA